MRSTREAPAARRQRPEQPPQMFGHSRRFGDDDNTRRNTSGRHQQPVWFAKHYDPLRAGSIDGTLGPAQKPHDKALIRALHARFDASKDPKINGNAKHTLFVGRLSFATDETRLRQVFERFGPIVKLRLVRDLITNQSKGYAFIEFASAKSFARAFAQTNGMELDARKILVDFERCRVMQGWKPRRLGGGLGGNKKSGQLRFGGRELPFRMPAALGRRMERYNPREHTYPPRSSHPTMHQEK